MVAPNFPSSLVPTCASSWSLTKLLFYRWHHPNRAFLRCLHCLVPCISIVIRYSRQSKLALSSFYLWNYIKETVHIISWSFFSVTTYENLYLEIQCASKVVHRTYDCAPQTGWPLSRHYEIPWQFPDDSRHSWPFYSRKLVLIPCLYC